MSIIEDDQGDTASRLPRKREQSVSMPEFAYQKIRERILENQWSPGFQATEQQVADILGISRTPVREALMRLQQEGLVAVVPRHGMRVLPISPKDMENIYQILTSLESTAVELAANKSLTDEEIAGLADATAAMGRALAQNDLEAWARADESFHSRLLDLCGNDMLKAVVLNFWDREHRVRILTLKLRPIPTNSTRSHMALVDALRKGDAKLARKLHQSQREKAGSELLEILKRLGLTNL